jgi:predicted regulator of Ras-like GTPase activity (Roadblock/LC7/MglB family)
VTKKSHRTQATEPTSLKEVLRNLNEAGTFKAVVLASADGLLINSVSAEYDADVMAAVVAMLRRVSTETQSQLGLAKMDEVVIRSYDRVRLVCRQVIANREELVLIVIVPPDSYYRRATNRAIKQIRQVLA